MKTQIVTVAHTKGGVGKSTLVWHTAVALADAGLNVTVLDLDFQQTATMTNAIRAARGLAPLNVIQIDDEVELMHFFDAWDDGVLLVDVGGFDSQLHRLAIQGADRVITPLKPSTTETLGFKAFEHVLSEIGSPAIDVLFNNAHHATRRFEEVLGQIGTYDPMRVLGSVIRSRANYDTAMGHGLGVTELPSAGKSMRAKAAKTSAGEIRALLQEVFDVAL